MTLATLGDGDVVPISDGARSLAVLEGLCGTGYMRSWWRASSGYIWRKAARRAERLAAPLD